VSDSYYDQKRARVHNSDVYRRAAGKPIRANQPDSWALLSFLQSESRNQGHRSHEKEETGTHRKSSVNVLIFFFAHSFDARESRLFSTNDESSGEKQTSLLVHAW